MRRLLPVTLITTLILGLMISTAHAQTPGIPDTSAIMRDIQNQASWQTYGALRSIENDRLRWYGYYWPYYSPYYWGRPVIIGTPVPRTQPGRGSGRIAADPPMRFVFPP